MAAVLCIILMCVCVMPVFALADTVEEAWTQCYGTNEPEDGVAVTTAGEGFYCALSVPRNDGEMNLTLVKTTSAGTEIWSCEYGHPESTDSVEGIAETADGGCVIVGSTDFFSVGGDADIWVLRVDSSGDEVWNLTLGGDSPDSGSAVLVLPGGGYAVLGTCYKDGTNGNDVYVAEVSADGVLLRENYYGGTLPDSGAGITALSAGGYAFVASSSSTDGDISSHIGSQDVWVGIVAADESLSLTDEWSFGSDGYDTPVGIVADDTDTLYCTARVYSPTGDVASVRGGSDIWIFSADSGTIGWESTYGGSNDDCPYALAIRDDGELICTGSSASSDGQVAANAGAVDVWTFAVNNATGDLLWNISSGGTGDDEGCGIALSDALDLGVLATTASSDAGYTAYHGDDDGVLLYLEESMEITTAFSADAISGEAPLTVSFTDASTGRGTTWLWDFGDGETSALQNPEHTYTESGVYTVTLTVSDTFGHTDTLTETSFITTGTAWTLPMNLIIDTPKVILTAGCDHSATDGFDSGYDVLAPPSAPGAVLTGWFHTPVTMGDTEFTRFSSDIRPVVDADNLYEKWDVTYISDDPFTLAWDASDLENTPVILTLVNGSENVDMRTEETCTIPAGSGVVYVNASYDTEVPVISSLSPEDGSCHYPAPYDITISADYTDNLGINTSAVALTVNGDDVTGISTITESGLSCPYSAEEGDYTVSLTVADLGGKTTSAEWSFTVTNETCLLIPLSPGWNMVSYPFEEDGLSVIFPEEVVQCFIFNVTSGMYESVATGSVTPGLGYWVAATGTSSVSLSGTCLQQYDTTLPQGWNLFGSLIMSVSADSLPAGINSDTVYRYNTTARMYEIYSILEPGAAYWLSAGDGDVSLSLSL